MSDYDTDIYITGLRERIEKLEQKTVRLTARIKQLETALYPFAVEARRWWGGGMDVFNIESELKVGDYGLAAEVMAEAIVPIQQERLK